MKKLITIWFNGFAIGFTVSTIWDLYLDNKLAESNEKFDADIKKLMDELDKYEKEIPEAEDLTKMS